MRADSMSTQVTTQPFLLSAKNQTLCTQTQHRRDERRDDMSRRIRKHDFSPHHLSPEEYLSHHLHLVSYSSCSGQRMLSCHGPGFQQS